MNFHWLTLLIGIVLGLWVIRPVWEKIRGVTGA